jgi:hypothetical protein
MEKLKNSKAQGQVNPRTELLQKELTQELIKLKSFKF